MSPSLALAALALLALLAPGTSALPPLPPDIARDANLTTTELAEVYGYPSETHTVTTEDGYILTLHRIPRGRDAAPLAPLGPPVFLQHGLFDSSADWVITGPEHALAYMLADAGYDVWMGNFRGSTYSRKHVKYTTKNKEYWNFSWHENGIHDLPAMIDYVLMTTGHQTLYYGGHSMGTTSFYILMSEKPEYNAKIRLMFSLAPIAFMSHATSPFLKEVAWTYQGDLWLWNQLGWYEFFPSTELMKKAGQDLCRDQVPTQAICDDVIFLVVGWNSDQLNSTQLPVILSHTPAGASSKQMLHYSQSVVSAHFRQWDYGVLTNVFHYGTAAPPDYDLSKVTAPITLHHADNDWVGNIVDIQKLNSSLPNVVATFRVSDPLFNHMDFMWGKDAVTLVYNDVLDMLKRY